MQVTWLELDDVDLAAVTDAVEVLLTQDRALAQIGAKVVDEHASFYVAGRSLLAIEA